MDKHPDYCLTCLPLPQQRCEDCEVVEGRPDGYVNMKTWGVEMAYKKVCNCCGKGLEDDLFTFLYGRYYCFSCGENSKVAAREGKINPAELIRDRRKELEDKVRKAVSEFQDEVDLAVTGIQVEFVDVSTIGGRYQTMMGHVKVTLEDL